MNKNTHSILDLMIDNEISFDMMLASDDDFDMTAELCELFSLSLSEFDSTMTELKNMKSILFP